MKSSKGLTLLEILVTLTLMAILFFPMIELLNSSFLVEYDNRMNVEAKEFREIALNRMSSTLKQASYMYSEGITIPTEKGTYDITPGSTAIIALIPSYDENGDLIQDETETEFDAYSYALIPANDYYTDSSSTDMVLVETYNNFNCTTSTDDPTKPASTCETDWSDASTNIIIEKAKPGTFATYSSTFNNENTSQIEIVFGSKNGTLYYPSTSGTTISSDNVHSIDIFCRNVSF